MKLRINVSQHNFYPQICQLFRCERVWVCVLGMGEEKPVSVFKCLKLEWISKCFSNNLCSINCNEDKDLPGDQWCKQMLVQHGRHWEGFLQDQQKTDQCHWENHRGLRILPTNVQGFLQVRSSKSTPFACHIFPCKISQIFLSAYLTTKLS